MDELPALNATVARLASAVTDARRAVARATVALSEAQRKHNQASTSALLREVQTRRSAQRRAKAQYKHVIAEWRQAQQKRARYADGR